MKRHFTLVILMLTCGLVLAPAAQGSTWLKTYGGDMDEWCFSMQQTTDGGFILTGYTNSFGPGKDNGYLMKLDAEGDTLWTKVLGGGSWDALLSVQQTREGGYILCGYTESFGGQFGGIWLIKTDGDGDTTWTRVYEFGQHGLCVQQTRDDGYIIAGTRGWSENGGMLSLLLIRTDEVGDTLWTQNIYTPYVDAAFCVRETDDDGFIAVGLKGSEWNPYASSSISKSVPEQKSAVSASDYDFYSDLWLVKTDADGDTLWTQTYGGDYNDVGFWVEQTPDGGYIITGSKGIVDLSGKRRADTPRAKGSESVGYMGDVWLIKTDEDGEIVWEKTMGGNQDDAGLSIQLTTDGGYIIAGTQELSSLPLFKNPSTTTGEMLSSTGAGMSAGRADCWLIKTDAQGDTVWTRIFGGTEEDIGFSVIQTSDGGYAFCGGTQSEVTGREDVLIVKTDSLGRIGEVPQWGDIDLSSATLAFGPVPVHDNALLSLWISNVGAGDLQLHVITITGDFTIQPAVPPARFITAGDSLEITVTFSPSETGLRQGTLTISSDDPDEPQRMVQLNGTGTQMDIELSLDSLDFGPVPLQNQFALSMWIYNTGTAPLSLDSLFVSGDFSVQPEIPPAQSIAAGDSLEITVTFTPTESGPTAGTFTIHSNDPDEPELTITLTGTGYESLTITTTFLPDGTAGGPYLETLNAAGGIPPYSWAVSGVLPPGFMMNISSGTISGISTTADTYIFVAVVTDSKARPDTARQELTITILPGQLTQVEITPDSVTLEPGQNQQFTASGSDVYGNPVPFQPLWDGTGGAIDQDGLYTAGSEDGVFVVTATDPVTTIQDHALVNIIRTVIKGDVNCDGNITPGDALCTFWRAILGQFQEECECDGSEQAAEVNCDGNITPGDALCIFWRAITGDWPQECQCE
jgi:hypothetical protein